MAVFWDSRRALNGEDCLEGLATGLLHSLVVFPLLSFGAIAPMASSPKDDQSVAALWMDKEPSGLRRHEGVETDAEDGVLKVIPANPLPLPAILTTLD